MYLTIYNVVSVAKSEMCMVEPYIPLDSIKIRVARIYQHIPAGQLEGRPPGTARTYQRVYPQSQCTLWVYAQQLGSLQPLSCIAYLPEECSCLASRHQCWRTMYTDSDDNDITVPTVACLSIIVVSLIIADLQKEVTHR